MDRQTENKEGGRIFTDVRKGNKRLHKDDTRNIKSMNRTSETYVRRIVP